MSRSPLLMESLPQSHNSLRGSGGNFTARVISASDQIEPIPDNVHDGRRRAFPVCSWETTWMNVEEKHSIILSGFAQVIALLMWRGGGTGGFEMIVWRSFWFDGIRFDGSSWRFLFVVTAKEGETNYSLLARASVEIWWGKITHLPSFWGKKTCLKL